jgi:hypothetical protein
MNDIRVQIILGLSIVLMASILVVGLARAQQTTIRDRNGQITTTITTDSNGQQTFRDGSGRTTGTANTDANGTTTFRDRNGSISGTEQRPRR